MPTSLVEVSPSGQHNRVQSNVCNKYYLLTSPAIRNSCNTVNAHRRTCRFYSFWTALKFVFLKIIWIKKAQSCSVSRRAAGNGETDAYSTGVAPARRLPFISGPHYTTVCKIYGARLLSGKLYESIGRNALAEKCSYGKVDTTRKRPSLFGFSCL